MPEPIATEYVSLKQAKESGKPDFVTRVRQAMVKEALAIMAGSKVNRRLGEYAGQVLDNADEYGRKFVYGVVTKIDPDKDANDSEIEAMVHTIFPAYARVFDAAPDEVVVEPKL